MAMEEQINPLALTHLLQHTLRSICLDDNSQWVYAVFWRILPRNYPPPKWDLQGGPFSRTGGNRRNWILVWEDGFCNFAASCGEHLSAPMRSPEAVVSSDCMAQQAAKGLQPELFFKMSHEIYNYGEGLIGKVAIDQNHKWVFKDPQDNEISLISSWNNPSDVQPRTWEAQFQSGIKTIALIAVREGVVQLGSMNKVMEDLSFVVVLRKRFSYLESIPGVLLPHPSSASFPSGCHPAESWPYATSPTAAFAPLPLELYDQFTQQVRITPSMSSLEALLSKLPSVGPVMTHGAASSSVYYDIAPVFASTNGDVAAMEMIGGVEKMVKEETEEDRELLNYNNNGTGGLGESSSSSVVVNYYQQQHQQVNVSKPSSS